MSTHVEAADIGAAWLAAFGALATRPELVNLTVTITNPLCEDLGVRRAIERRLVQRHQSKNDFKLQSLHTVANTIFPVSLYRPGVPDARSRFFARVADIEAARRRSRKTGWGTYIGRLVSYPSPDGGYTNQLEQVLEVLGASRSFTNRYELPIVAPDRDTHADQSNGHSAVLQGGRRAPAPARGGPCLAHISLANLDGALSLVALYRNQTYEDRAYGNFLGLARLLAFLANESGRRVGELMVVANHAEAILPQRSALLRDATAAAGTKQAIELSARPLGASMSDLKLPSAVA